MHPDRFALYRIFEAIPHGIIGIRRDFTILFSNSAVSLLTGKGAGEGRKCHEIFPGSLCHTPECPVTRLMSGGDRMTYDVGKHCKNTWKTPCIVTVCPLRDSDGAFAGIVETISDASSLRKAEADLIDTHERLRKAMGGVIQAMSLAIEKRDPYTAGHQRRVAKLCRAIGMLLGLEWETIQGLRMGAAVHDVGKIQVPAGILNKPGDLSEYEWGIIRQHVQTGYEILKNIEFPWPLAEMIRQHHERLDGSGYPRGLKGDEILLEARILTVADVAEAISSFRPYRPAKGIDAAVEELKKGRGRLYDPGVVDICLDLLCVKGFDFETKSWRRQFPG